MSKPCAGWLFDDVADLRTQHYLGAAGARGRLSFEDENGLIVFSGPSSRRLPASWLELSRWCLLATGLGSVQWSRAAKWLRGKTDATTVVSYSDPSVGHDGALYRACGWCWAPTWHVLRPPPTGAGVRGGKRQAAKHRWVFLLHPDLEREALLSLRDESLSSRFPFASFTEPRWKRGIPQLAEQAPRFKRWVALARTAP